jgi:hypothetical protein
MFFGSLFVFIFLIAHLHLVVWATSERFPQVKATFRVGLANESHWLQPVLVGNIHWWIAPVNVGGLLYEIVASSNHKNEVSSSPWTTHNSHKTYNNPYKMYITHTQIHTHQEFAICNYTHP